MRGEANFVRAFSRPSEVVGTSYLVGLLIYTSITKKNSGSKIFSFDIFCLHFFVFWCVRGGPENVKILACSTLAEVLGQVGGEKVNFRKITKFTRVENIEKDLAKRSNSVS